MRLLAVFVKSLREQLRDPLALALTLVFAPLLVLIYWLFFPSEGSTVYTVLVINEDSGVVIDGQAYQAGVEATEAIRTVTYASGNPLLKVRQVANQAEAAPLLRDRQALVYVVFPTNFSEALVAASAGDETATTKLVFGGDLTNPYYSVAAILATTAVDAYVQQATDRSPLAQYVEEPLGGSGTRTEFEIYVPGLFVFAIVMLVFLAAMTVAREVETGTLGRMKITRLTSFELLGGNGLSLILIGLLGQLLTLATALALGFRSQGPIWVLLLVGFMTSVSVIGVGMIVAAFSKSVTQAFLIANFPLALFMFFTDAVFPIPPVKVLVVAGRSIGLFDFLPPRHAVLALNKVLTLGLGLNEILYELAWLTVLSAIYFLVGAWLFQRRHLQATIA